MSTESINSTLSTSGLVIKSETVSDKSVMESVVDFIHDVVPQAYSGTIKPDEKKDKILWVTFENYYASDDKKCGNQNGNVLPMILVLGYVNGVQLWAVMGNGEAQELLSVRQGAVKILRVLPDPATEDLYCEKRPIFLTCDFFNASQQCNNIRFRSLRTGEQVHGIKLKYSVCDIQCNRNSIVVTFTDKISIFNSSNFQDCCSISNCYPSGGSIINPIALGSQWLAFSDRVLMSVHQTCGGVSTNGVQSYTASVIHAAKTITKGLTFFGETVASSISGASKTNLPSSPNFSSTISGPAKVKPSTATSSKLQPGVVTIIDPKFVPSGELHISDDWVGEGLVAHFPAHEKQPIMAMKFDPSGSLLITACKLGHDFHVFRILAHPGGSSLGAVHHLYTLHRGDTTSKVQNISFTIDSRWVAVSTLRGTTHIFPLTPYGGPISVRTHSSSKVVNRLSRFQRSAGLDDIQSNVAHRNNPSGGRSSPILSSSPGSTAHRPQDLHPCVSTRNTSAGRMGNPRLPPYTAPTIINPLAQIKQPLVLFPGMQTSSASSSPNLSNERRRSSSGSSDAEKFNTVASTFASPRGLIIGSPSFSREKSEKRSVDSLYVISCHGTLVEYVLEPKPTSSVSKVADDTAIELEVQARAQWPLCRETSSSEVKLPLSPNAALFPLKAELTDTYPLSLKDPNTAVKEEIDELTQKDEQWLSQVEMITHTGPHRRLWMGPQFQFMTCQHQASTTLLSSTSSALLSSPESTTSSDITEELDLQSLNLRPARSNPVAMPGHSSTSGCNSSLPVFIEAASGSFEQSPSILEVCSRVSNNNQSNWPEGYPPGQSIRQTDPILEHQLRENLAEAMLDFSNSDLHHTDNTCLSAASSICHASSGEFQASSDDLSSPSSHSDSVSQSFDANSPPQTMEHVLVFPTSSPESLS